MRAFIITTLAAVTVVASPHVAIFDEATIVQGEYIHDPLTGDVKSLDRVTTTQFSSILSFYEFKTEASGTTYSTFFDTANCATFVKE